MALEQLSLEQFRLGCIILFYFKMEFEKSSAEMNCDQKSDNLHYDMLVCWFAGTNDSSTKLLMFQVLFFFHKILQNSLQKHFQFIYFYFL